MIHTSGGNDEFVDLSELITGKRIQCQACHRGYYIPDNGHVKKEYYYHCNKCGDKVKLEPVIDFKEMFGADE